MTRPRPLRKDGATRQGRSLHVGYVLDRFPVLSQTFVSGEIRELEKQGVTVTVIAHRRADPGPRQADLVPTETGLTTRQLELQHLGFLLRRPVRYARFLARVRRVSSEVGPGHKRFDWRLLPGVATDLEARGVQQLHAHFAWAGAAAAYCLAALMDVPWSLTAHANDIFAERSNLAVKISASDRLITVCEYNRDYLVSELGVTRPIDIVLCGVELPSAPAPADLAEIDILAVGRLVPKKGFDLLVDALALLSRTRNVTARIIGEGPERDQLARRIHEAGLETSVELVGAVSHVETLEQMTRARLLCLPARIAPNGDRDSMPVVIKEAMALALPVVATDVVAIPEMVDVSVGRLVPCEDAQALARALEEILTMDESSRAALGASGRDRVEAAFTLSHQTARLKQIFLTMLRTPS